MRKRLQRNALHSLLGYCFTLTLLLMLTRLKLVSGNPGARDCDIETFRKNLARVCAVYIKRSAEYFMARPLLNPDGSLRKSTSALFDLWGYYLREWKNSQGNPGGGDDRSGGYLYQLSPGEQRDVLIPPNPKVEVSSIPPKQDVNYALSNKKNFHPVELGNDSFEGLGILQEIRVVSSDSSSTPSIIPKAPPYVTSEPFFKRWRRNPMLKSLVVKCCSRGCNPDDFVVVAHEYSFCK